LLVFVSFIHYNATQNKNYVMMSDMMETGGSSSGSSSSSGSRFCFFINS
jgi:hypothetical protein